MGWDLVGLQVLGDALEVVVGGVGWDCYDVLLGAGALALERFCAV